MSEMLARFTTLPAYGIAALIVLLLYAVQSQIRFGSKARSGQPGPADRKSTLALASGNWVTLVASVIATSAAYAYRIRVEDEMLSAAFGRSYDEYRRRVPALIPRVSNRDAA